MKIYLAGYELKDEMNKIVLPGHTIVSRWHKEDYKGDANEIIARMDLEDIKACDLMLVFTDWIPTGGGRYVEMGYALARGKEVAIIGTRINIFCSLVPRYDDIEGFLNQTYEPIYPEHILDLHAKKCHYSRIVNPTEEEREKYLLATAEYVEAVGEIFKPFYLKNGNIVEAGTPGAELITWGKFERDSVNLPYTAEYLHEEVVQINDWKRWRK